MSSRSSKGRQRDEKDIEKSSSTFLSILSGPAETTTCASSVMMSTVARSLGFDNTTTYYFCSHSHRIKRTSCGCLILSLVKSWVPAVDLWDTFLVALDQPNARLKPSSADPSRGNIDFIVSAKPGFVTFYFRIEHDIFATCIAVQS